MTDVLDYTADLDELARLASQPDSLDDVLIRALDALGELIPYDLAAVLQLDGEHLRVRTARGPFANADVNRHSLELARFPSIRRVMNTRRPMAMLEHNHASDEGDPYDGVLDLPHGHSCMLVPLFAGGESLGIITLDRGHCAAYDPGLVALAGVVGQIVSLAMAYADQAALLGRYRTTLEERARLLEAEVPGGSRAGELLACSGSPIMTALLQLGRAVAATSTPVMIMGETGVGKEVLAHAIHEWSPRRDHPFVKLNCAAIPEALVESELFGHVKGAFSGATGSRAGRFLTANGGTLLLDEIGEMPLSAQSKLLRVLQSGTFEPVGSDRTAKVDVRVVAATHVDLLQAVREGRFREDLYYRLAVFPLTLPPLRERREDVGHLATGILADLAERSGRGPWFLTPKAEATLAASPWPGNVRELRNMMERATIMVPAGSIEPEHLLGLTPVAAAPAAPRIDDVGPLVSLAENERRHVTRVLEATSGRLYGDGGAASVLGLKPTTLQSRMKKLGLSRADFG